MDRGRRLFTVAASGFSVSTIPVLVSLRLCWTRLVLLKTDSASVMRSTTPCARTQINIRHRQSCCIGIYYYYRHWTVEAWAGKVRVGVGRWGCEEEGG